MDDIFWEKLAEDHYVTTVGEKTVVLTTAHTDNGMWSALVRETGKREQLHHIPTFDIEFAKDFVESIYFK